MNPCNILQHSLDWCEGKPSRPGLKKDVYYIAKSKIVGWPTLTRNSDGRLTTARYVGNFVFAANTVAQKIVCLPDKSTLTSEAQGEKPSQTQLNKLTLVHPGVGEAATLAVAGLNNFDNIYFVPVANGTGNEWRVVGCEAYDGIKTTCQQDQGQGVTGATGTTISVEATDDVPAPFYGGRLSTVDGIINDGSGSGAAAE